MKEKIKLRSVFVFSIMAGFLISFFTEELNEFIYTFIIKKYKILNISDIVIQKILFGIIIGILIYFLIKFYLKAFEKKLLSFLIKKMREKKILPYNFKIRKRALSTNIINIFNSFLTIFENVKQDKDKLSKTIETYLDPSLQKEIKERGINEIYLGGKRKIATILFTDLRGFTSFVESHTPDDVIRVLNEYFSESTKIINKNRGSVNKYIGDAILGVFEEPPKYLNYIDADKAIISALDIMSKFDILKIKWKKEIDSDLKLGLGIGVARGEVLSGNMGSEDRMEYTVIGDTVNFASRLCSLAMDGQILISDDVYSLIEELVEVESLPPVSIKGKTGFFNIYNVKTRKMLM